MPKGKCLCGNVEFKYEQPVMKCICHCLTCRKLTGSTFATTIMVRDEDFQINIPLDNLNITESVHEVGMVMSFYSCTNCPSTVFKTADGFPGAKVVLAGLLEGNKGASIEHEGKPTAELWTKYRVPWLLPLAGCLQFDGFPPS